MVGVVVPVTPGAVARAVAVAAALAAAALVAVRA